MNLAVAFVLGLAAGAVACWWLQRPVVAHLKDELHWARQEIATATDRLLHAWREDKAVIPPRPPEPVPPPEPLPRELQAEVDQWESPESRAVLEQKIRAMLARGMQPAGILLALDNEHPASERA